MISLKGRSLLTLMDFSKEEINYLIDLAKQMKNDKKEGVEWKRIGGKNIVLLFEKDSTRTRCAFEVAAHDQGVNVTYIGPTGSQMGKKESIKDTAKVLGRMYDGIEYRGYGQEIVETLAKYSGVPVWNGLTDEDHPTQVLADFLTIKEYFNKSLDKITLAYLGDGRNNVANALLIGASKVGMNINIVSPEKLLPEEALIERCKKVAEESGSIITITSDINKGVKGVDVIYTDVWVSMGEPDEVWKERLEMLLPYRVDMNMIKATENPDVKFMHCLPSFHDLGTAIGKQIYEKYGLDALEVTDEVFESEYSIVFDEAENRMHTIKAVIVATI
ncbi:ornithine carbamoyltransferase [Clostridium homopropionicum DSM 5847]|uniref:Ornithine carbamoyltransferase n=1 Tax=Clostridium homopropionicum DSM 5847 TaxID=1121318 RepID=A0A0L6Z819_9CLOT|nr:ornithine carbamoyltransferase [Clostridium homopropionicum]KOA19110.1 ornithine carbamoyltransferase [Clostridium homopropionicum DSM 5847]SFG83923.1 ornithine carbamoyltransferase [Clostridium homopropionicum]